MNRKEKYAVSGMHCASCSSIIERILGKVPGVLEVEVSYGTESAKLLFDPAQVNIDLLQEKLTPLGYKLITQQSSQTGRPSGKEEKLKELARMRQQVFYALPLALWSIVLMGWDILSRLSILDPLPEDAAKAMSYILPTMATYVLVLVGRPYLLGVYRFFRYGKANMDTLIGIGTGVAYLYSVVITLFASSLSKYIATDMTYFDVTIVVITFIALGKYLEARAKLKTGDAIEALLSLQAKTALIKKGGSEVEVSIENVMKGDIVIVKPGVKIPVDGVVLQGASYVNESMLTGESMPVKKSEDDSVAAGTLNESGSFEFRATKVGSETMLAHIIAMVEEAQGSKAPIQALADKISAIFVPIVIGLAFLSLGGWLVFGVSSLGLAHALSYGLASFVGVLVIACPCALGLATPTAIIVGVGKGAREGILVKDAKTLETLEKVSVMVLDKTGTLTKGKPELTEFHVLSKDHDHDTLIALLAGLEAKSEHPIAHAILGYAHTHNITPRSFSDFEAIKGKGVRGTDASEVYVAGNTKLIAEMGLSLDKEAVDKEAAKGKTPIILASKDAVLGIAYVADPVKPEAKESIATLRRSGVHVVMLTGDNAQTAKFVAREVGIDEVIAEVLPEDKLNAIKKFQSEGKLVAMTGDGVNDAPALAQADVGIAMATGTDVAIASAGITLLHGDIRKLVKAIHLSKMTMRGIKQNLFWAFFYNLIGIPLAGGAFYPLFGWLLSPVFAGLAMALSSVSVVSNSLRLKAKKL